MSSHSTLLKKPTVIQPTPFGFWQLLLLGVRLFGAFVAMLIAFVVSGAVIPVQAPAVPGEASQAVNALVIVSLVTSLILSFLILRSRWHGLKLMAAIVVVLFGVQTFISQIETLFFINALKMPLDLVLGLIATGFVRALIFAPLAVLVLGKWRGDAADEPFRVSLSARQWAIRAVALALFYVLCYFAFGYFVAYQWSETRDYYAGTFAMDWVLPLFQVLRGLMWAGLALLIVALMRGKKWETYVGVGLAFATLIATSLLFPNPFMPAIVRQAHFFELMSSMLTYGAVAGWVWLRGAK